MVLLTQFAILLFVSYLINVACHSFELGSRRLGTLYHFPPGIRGATINAIGSSLPEFFTTFFLLFLYKDQNGFAAGIATCAGSALFNGIIIPSFCILAVLFWGIQSKKQKTRVTIVSIERNIFLRDIVFFLFASVLLIWILTHSALTWWMGGLLLCIYGLYVLYIYQEVQTKQKAGFRIKEEVEDGVIHESKPPLWKQIISLDFHGLLFKYQRLDKTKSWMLLLCSVAIIAIACHQLANSVIAIAKEMNVPLFFTAVILAAATTSVPDTILSIKDARAGDYDDAVSNAFGSNLFDITVCLGFPLFLYGLFYQSVPWKQSATANTSSAVELQVFLVLATLATLLIAFWGNWKEKKLSFGRGKAILLLSIYAFFLVFIVGKILSWGWIKPLSNLLSLQFLRG